MPDKKLTDNEIIKALKTLLELVLVEGCLQRAKTISKALDLINRQKAEIEAKHELIQCLIANVEDQKAEIESLEQNLKEAHIDIKEHLAENERLFADNQKFLSVMLWGNKKNVKNLLSQIKAEAYKECIEKVKELMDGWGDLEFHSEAIKAENDLDNLLKELVGDNDES